MMILGKPGRHLFQVKHEQGRINGHIKDTGGQREPRFLKAPEVAQAAAHPCVIAALVRQRARKFADHESCRQAPKHRQKQQDQDSASVACAGNDRFSAVCSAGHHKERSGNKRPERQFCGSFFRDGDALGRNLGWKRYSAQFFSLVLLKRLSLSKRAEQAHHSKNTVSVRSCKRKMSCDGNFFQFANRMEVLVPFRIFARETASSNGTRRTHVSRSGGMAVIHFAGPFPV